jgi:metal-responsive CopG/Arc/MetJ family transcriptional regulator
MSNENMSHIGIYFPKDILKRIDERRGRYYSRNRYFLKIAEEHLAKFESGIGDQQNETSE